MSQAIFHWTQGVGPAIGSPPLPTTWIPDLSGGIPTSTAFNNVDFMSIDGWNWTGKAGFLNYIQYPISVSSSATNYSYEKWLRTYFQFAPGTTNQISNVHFFRGNTNGMNDPDLKVFAACQPTYLTPQGGSKRINGAGNFPILYSVGTPPSHTWGGPTIANTDSNNNDWLGDDLGNTRISLYNGTTSENFAIDSSGWSDWIVLQLEVSSTVSTPGNIGTLSWRCQYDES